MNEAARIARAVAKRERQAARQRQAWWLADLDAELHAEAAALTDRHERAWHVEATHAAIAFGYDVTDAWDRWVDAMLAWAGHDPQC